MDKSNSAYKTIGEVAKILNFKSLINDLCSCSSFERLPEGFSIEVVSPSRDSKRVVTACTVILLLKKQVVHLN